MTVRQSDLFPTFTCEIITNELYFLIYISLKVNILNSLRTADSSFSKYFTYKRLQDV